MTGLFAWLGGGAFVGSLAGFVYTYTVVLGRPAAPDTSAARALVVDTLLFLLFATHHSLFARPWIKRHIVRFAPASLERSLYVWVASLLLALVCAAWQPLPGTVYASHGLAAFVHWTIVATGLILIALGARALSPLELAGIDQARHKPRVRAGALVTAFPYSLVRHPIYLGWVLGVFGVPRMTASRLVMACLSSAYLAVAIPWEEALLVREFGAVYREYARRVRWRMIPFVY